MPSASPLRSAGLLTPLFALRREGDLGIGDTRALRELMLWAAKAKVGFLQLLPINEMGPDNSPYNAISSVALDPVLLEVSAEAIPELTDDDVAAVRGTLADGVLQGPLVCYREVRAAKRQLLELAYERFVDEERVAAFEAFREAEKAWLPGYAVFRTLIDRQGHELWDQWPAGVRESVDATDAEAGFHSWVQWIAFTQWRELRRLGQQLGVRLMGDIPIGVSYYSSDVFDQPELFDLEWSGGAPPERIFKDDLFVQKWGQNWGIPLYRWERMAEDQFAWWRQRVDKLTDVFDLFRIDHVLGFYRIYGFPWRPQRNEEFLPLTEAEAKERTGGRVPGFRPHGDDSEANRATNRAAGDRYLKMVKGAAAGAEVIGEDLGEVPPYVRPHLLEIEVPGFKIPQWEVGEGDHATRGEQYPECSFTTYATHDHPPMKAMWEGNRLAMTEASDAEDRMKAGRELRLLSEFCGLPAREVYPVYDEAIQWQMVRGLLGSRARYAAIMITDLFGLEDRFNVPGVLRDSNWRTRLPFAVEALSSSPELTGPAASFTALIEATERG